MKFLRRWLDKVLQGTYDHFWCHLPGRQGWFTRLMLRLFYTGIDVDNDDLDALRELEKDGIVIFATKHRSLFEVLFFHTRYAQMQAPYPEIAFDRRFVLGQPLSRVFRIILGYADHVLRFRAAPNPYKSHFFRRQLCAGKSALVHMVSAKGFYKRYVKAKPDPLAYLLRMQIDLERPIYVVPHLFLFGTKPRKSRPGMLGNSFGSEDKPGRIRRLVTLFKTPEKVMVEMSEPINLKKFLEVPGHRNRTIEYLSYALRQTVLDRINQHQRAILGPVLKSQQEIKETVLRNDDFRRFLQERAIAQGKRVQDFHKEVDKYLDEIAAKYDTNMIEFLKTVVKWLTDTMFDGVDLGAEGLKKYKKACQKGPVILVPCHKSHIDYLILSYLLYVNNLPCPLIAAGKNLSFWPMGTIFRNCGAFFIRRTFKGAALYSRVFSEYIHRILEAGFNIEFFLEGGRSRTGKLVLPKFGLLSILLSAYRQGACRNLNFVPIYIGYDRVLEEGDYVYEIEGGKKKAESLSGLVKARRVLKKRYGRIFVRFDDPIDIQDVLKHFDTPFERMDVEEQGVVCRNLGHRIIEAINSVTVVTPHSLAASVVLTGFEEGFTPRQLCARAEFFLRYFSILKAELSTTLKDPEPALLSVLDSFVNDKFITEVDKSLEKQEKAPEPGLEEDEEPPQRTYQVVPKGRSNLEYYKNNCISYFVAPAMTSLAVLVRDAEQFSLADLAGPYQELQTLFKNEFHYELDVPNEQQLRKTMKIFMDLGFATAHATLPETYVITPQGIDKMGLFSKFLKCFFESYRVVLTVLSLNSAEDMAKKDRVKKFSAMGFRLEKMGELACREAISKVTFDNAYSYYSALGLHGNEQTDKIEKQIQILDKYLRVIP